MQISSILGRPRRVQPLLDGPRSHQYHQPRCPRQLRCDTISAAFQVRDQNWDLRCVPLRPTWLRQEIIDEIDPADFEKGQCPVQMAEFARPSVRIDEVELLRRCLSKELAAVPEMKRDSRVVPKIPPRDIRYLGVAIDRDEVRASIHTGK